MVPPQVARRAVEWWVDRQAGRTDEAFDAALARWRTEDPAHDAAWRHIETMQRRFGGLAAGPTRRPRRRRCCRRGRAAARP